MKDEWYAHRSGAALPKGGEHLVYPDLDNQIAVKLTDPGLFGAKQGLSDYLNQARLSNATFDDHIRIEGFVRLPGENADRLVITQPWVKGRHPTAKELDAYMISKGFRWSLVGER